MVWGSFLIAVGSAQNTHERWLRQGANLTFRVSSGQVMLKVAYALAAGCTVVLKPSDW